MGLFAKSKEPFLRGFLRLEMAFPAMTRSAGFSACSIRSSSGRRFSGSWLVSPSNAKGLWRSTARFCAARSTAPVASRRCTWSPPGLRATPCAGADRHRREVERNYRRAETAGDAAAERTIVTATRSIASAPSPSRSSIRRTMPSPWEIRERFMTRRAFSHDPASKRSPPSRRRGRSWPHRNPYGHGSRPPSAWLEQTQTILLAAWPSVGKSSASRETAARQRPQTAYHLLSALFYAQPSTKSSAPLRRKSPALALDVRHRTINRSL